MYVQRICMHIYNIISCYTQKADFTLFHQIIHQPLNMYSLIVSNVRSAYMHHF